MNFFITAVFATLRSLAPVPEIPFEFWAKSVHAGGPVWIHASRAVSGEGKLVEGRLAPADVIKLKYRLAKSVSQPGGEESCDVALGALFDDSPAQQPVPSLAAVKARAQQGRAISGTITATAVGFYSGSPFTVLQVVTGNGAQTVYLLYPRGAIDVDGKRICTIDARYAADPQVHDEVIAVLEEAVDERGHLYRVQPELLFFEKDGYTLMSGLLRGLNRNAEHRFDAFKRELLAIRNDRDAAH